MKPILFNTDMVQAILENRKTQTRRIVKLNGCKSFDVPSDWDKEAIDHWTGGKCPYGQVGDVLWVRETWKWDIFTGGYFALYRADYSTNFGAKWKPSIHMPFEACRLFLKITNIRVERLQEITCKDVLAEGMDSGHDSSFITLWQSINGAKSWDSNPWVWVIEFKRISKEEVSR
jgi:hypothetical protein